jgi:GH15 family glucan-1,4-alpha-glucosidase
MLQNIDIDGKGGVLASPDRNVNQGGSYYYAWMRDASLTMRTLLRTFPKTPAGIKLIQEKFAHYLQW